MYDGAEVPFLPDIYPNTVICYSYSKSLSMPGERIGYICVPDRAAGAARSLGHVCAPLPSTAGSGCLRGLPA